MSSDSRRNTIITLLVISLVSTSESIYHSCLISCSAAIYLGGVNAHWLLALAGAPHQPGVIMDYK